MLKLSRSYKMTNSYAKLQKFNDKQTLANNKYYSQKKTIEFMKFQK